MTRRTLNSVVSVVALVLAACGGSGAQSPPAWPLPAASSADCEQALVRSFEAADELDDAATFDVLSACTGSDAGSALAAMRVESLVRESIWHAEAAREYLEANPPRGVVAEVFHARIRERLAELDHGRQPLAGWLDRSPYGSASVWQSLGPLSSFEVLGFDEVDALALGETLPMVVELASGPVHRADTLPGRLGAVEPAAPQAGVHVLESWVDAGAGGVATLVVDATTGFELFVDDTLVLRRAPQDVWSERVVARQIELGAGAHRVRVKVAADRARSFRVQWIPASEVVLSFPESGRGSGTGATVQGGQTDTVDAWLTAGGPIRDAMGAAAVGDLAMAARLMDVELPRQLAARMIMLRHDVPPAVRDALSLDALRDGLVEDAAPAGIAARVGERLLSSGRDAEAAPWIASALRAAPESAAAVAVAASEAEAGAWDEQEWELRRRLAVLAPEDCRNAARVADLLDVRRQPVVPEQWPGAWLQCAAFAEAVVDRHLFPTGQTHAAVDLLRQTARRAPQSDRLLLRWARAAEAHGRDGERMEALDLLRRFSALDTAALGYEVDAAVASGDARGARELASRLFTLDPGDLYAREAVALATDGDLLDEWREDGAHAVAQYQADVVSPPSEVVLVLDASTSVFTAEGTRIDIVHQVAQLNTRDALDAFGEAGVPPGALVLSARTIKADGRVLVPEDISGEDALSMPGLEVGDFIELEWAQTQYGPVFEAPANRTERFFFQGFDGWFHRSISRFVVPTDHLEALRIDVRNFHGTERVEERGESTLFEFEARDQASARPDPVGPPPLEWLPSVRVAMAYPIELSRRMFEDALEKLVGLPAHLADEVERELRGLRTDRDRVRAIHRIVVDDTVDAGSFFRTPAAWGWTSGEGERLTLLVGLLRSQGYEPDVVFVRPFEQDPTEGAFDDLAVYDLTAVRVPTRGGDIWLEPDFDRYPFDFLRLEAQGQPGLVIAGPQAGQRVTTPTWPAETRRNEIRIQIDVERDGSARVVIDEQIPLRLASGLRSYIQSDEDERTVARELEIAVSGSFPGVEGLELEIFGLEEREAPIRIRYAFVSRGLFQPDGAGQWVRDDGIFERPLAGWYAARPERDLPLVVSVPLFETMEVTWTLPAGGSFLETPANEVYSFASSAFERRSEIRGAALTTTRVTELPLQRVAPERYPEFATFLRAWELGSRAEIRATW